MSETKGSILVVDDDPTLLSMLTDTLTAIGYESVAASDGIEALDLLINSEYKFDLMITDIKMPSMDGIGLLKRARRHCPDLPVLFITAYASREIIAQTSPNGLLAKPFRISHLENMIERALANKNNGNRPPQRRKVLVNVDDETLRRSLTEALSCSDYLPFPVAGGDEALQELERGHFDVMIAEIENTAAESGVDTVRRAQPDLPVVAVSASRSADDIDRVSQRLKLNGYLEKPLTIGRLIALLDKTTRPTAESVN